MNKYMEGLLSAISFFTIIPVRGNREISRNTMYFFTFTGLIIGLIAGIPYLILRPYSPLIASAVSIALVVLLYGFNHLDSIMDFGDSAMVRGIEAKQRVIKDKYTGSGGIGMLFVIYIPSIAFLTYFRPMSGFLIIIGGEIVSKYATLISMYNSRPFGEGLGKMFIGKISNNAIFFNIIPVILVALFNLYYIAATAMVIILAYALKSAMEKFYGGLNGDLIGSIGEISRLLFYAMAFIFAASGLSLFLL